MAEEFKGTTFDTGKGNAEFSEVEELIRQTLEESKKLEKPVESSPAAAADAKKEEYKATTLNAPIKPPAPPASKEAAKPSTPASSYDATFKEYKVGDIVKAKVLKIDQSGILADIKYKADGLILPEELSEKAFGAPEEVVKVGDIIDVLIENLENKEGYVVLSKKKADYEKKWKLAGDAYRHKTLLEGKVIQALRGGLVIECQGIRGFIPASQVSKKPEETLESFVGKIIPVKVIEVNSRQGKIVLSHKIASGDKEKFDNQKLFNELEVGQVRKGKVVSIKNFGAFVDLGGVEGLIHLSELSWKRVKHPTEVVKMGEELEVFVLGVDKINRKVALGLKELQPDPWANAADIYKAGQIVKAKVLRFAKFGAFAELEHGLEGLIHLSEISKEHISAPGEAIKIGETYDVKILRVLPEEQRIGLSIKQVIIDHEKQALREVAAQAEDKKVTIGDMIAEKERAKAEQEEEPEEEAPEEIA
ncbi:MAG: S1 RNA-binding domain-containing protein [bacterium]